MKKYFWHPYGLTGFFITTIKSPPISSKKTHKNFLNLVEQVSKLLTSFGSERTI
jgi:hypothetical protein